MNADEIENVFCKNPCEKIPSEAAGLNIRVHNIDQSQCEMTSNSTQFNHGAIWWPQYTFYNFEANLEIEFPQEIGPVGGVLFRAKDISACGGATFGACQAYSIDFHSNQIGLKGPGSTHPDGWLYEPQSYSNIGNKGQLQGHHWISIDVIEEIIAVKIDDYVQLLYNNLQLIIGGIGYRIPQAMDLTVYRIEMRENSGHSNSLCRSGWNQFGAANFKTDYRKCRLTGAANAGIIWLGVGANVPKEEYGNFEAEIKSGFIFGAQDVNNCANTTFGNCNAYFLYFQADVVGLQKPGGEILVEPLTPALTANELYHILIEYRRQNIRVMINGVERFNHGPFDGIHGGIGIRVDGPTNLIVSSIQVHESSQELFCRSDWKQVNGAEMFTPDDTNCQLIVSPSSEDGVIWLGDQTGTIPTTVYADVYMWYGFTFMKPNANSGQTRVGGLLFRASDVSGCADDFFNMFSSTQMEVLEVTEETTSNDKCNAYFLNLYHGNCDANGNCDKGYIELQGPNGNTIKFNELSQPLRATTEWQHEWNNVDIDLYGQHIEVRVNGDNVLTSDALNELQSGSIGYKVTDSIDLTLYHLGLHNNNHGGGEDPFCESTRLWTALTGSFIFEENNNVCSMEVTALGPNDVALIEVDRDVEICDFSIIFDLTVTTLGTTAGIFMRNEFPGEPGANNLIGYFFGVTPSDGTSTSTYRVGYYDSIGGTIEGEVDVEVIGTTIEVGTSMSLTIMTVGDQIMPFINGVAQSVVTDGTRQCGSAGFMVENGLAVFSNLMPGGGGDGGNNGGNGNGNSQYGEINTCGHMNLQQDVMCLQTDGADALNAHSCSGGDDQTWAYDKIAGIIEIEYGGTCWDVNTGGDPLVVYLQACDSSLNSQKWEFQEDGTIRNIEYNDMCVSVDSNHFMDRTEEGDIHLLPCDGDVMNNRNQQICFDRYHPNPPIDCLVGPWQNNGGGCSEECGPKGKITQKRKILRNEENGGTRGECDNVERDAACNTHIKCTPNNCKLGKGYGLDGFSAESCGDPHFRTFYGGWHDYQGSYSTNDNKKDNQLYYMHPCMYDNKGGSITRKDMPFSLLVQHWSDRWKLLEPQNDVAGIDYVVFELYEPIANGDMYYVWLSSDKHSYGSSTTHSSSVYDETNTGTDLTLPGDTQIGTFTISLALVDWGTLKVILTMNDGCTVELRIEGSKPWHCIRVEPPQCYKCYTCGLLGDFYNKIDRGNPSRHRLQTCDGNDMMITRGWWGTEAEATAYDSTGLTWQKTYMETNNCASSNWNINSRRRQLSKTRRRLMLEPQADPNIPTIDSCPSGSQSETDAIAACDACQTMHEECYNATPDKSKELKKGCVFDVCVLSQAEGETRTHLEIAEDVFGLPLEDKCTIPGNEDAEDLSHLCVLHEWIDGECIGQCGGIGTQHRTRTIDFDNGGTYDVCADVPLEEDVTCIMEDCVGDPTGCNWIQTNVNTDGEIFLGDMTTEACVAQTRATGCDIANIGFENNLDPLSQIENAVGSCWCQYGQDTTQDDNKWYSCFFKESGNGNRCPGVCDEDKINNMLNNGYNQESVGMCGESCVIGNGAPGAYGEWCKCCVGLSRSDCVADGDNSMCGWFYHEGCGYCMDWGSDETCGNFDFVMANHAPDEEHCNPNGIVDLETCNNGGGNGGGHDGERCEVWRTANGPVAAGVCVELSTGKWRRYECSGDMTVDSVEYSGYKSCEHQDTGEGVIVETFTEQICGVELCESYVPWSETLFDGDQCTGNAQINDDQNVFVTNKCVANNDASAYYIIECSNSVMVKNKYSDPECTQLIDSQSLNADMCTNGQSITSFKCGVPVGGDCQMYMGKGDDGPGIPTAAGVCYQWHEQDQYDDNGNLVNGFYSKFECLDTGSGQRIHYNSEAECANEQNGHIEHTEYGVTCGEIACGEVLHIKHKYYEDTQCETENGYFGGAVIPIRACSPAEDKFINVDCCGDTASFSFYSDDLCTQDEMLGMEIFNYKGDINKDVACMQDNREDRQSEAFMFNCPYECPEIPGNTEVCPRDAITFDWDELTEHGIGKPDVTFTINVDESPQTDLSLNIEVRVPYIVRASADDQLNANFGTTYVLDFEDFDAHKSSITQPNSCSNRVESDYSGKTSTSSRFEIVSDDFNAIGTSNNMCYPPTDGTGWVIAKEESDCNSILYKGKWKWGELTECRNNGNALTDGGVQQTSVDNTNKEFLQLFGTFYVNIVSPFWYEDYDNKNMDFYRVYQLISQPFVIQISKSVYVIGKTGINVMTMSIIAVYKEDQDEEYILILLTEAAEYMELINGQIINVPNSTQFELAMQSTSESNGCLNNKAYLCGQLWKIYTTKQTCTNNRDEINHNGGIDFSGDYRLRFTPQCRQNIGGYDSETHCLNWLEAHPNDNNGVALSSHLTFVDGICKAKTFTIQLEATMNFYENPDYTGYIDPKTSSHLYQVGVDTVYGEIILTFPTATEEIFDSTLINVWLCTFPPGTDPLPPNQNGPDINKPAHDATNGGCFSRLRDGFTDGEGDEFFFHVYGVQETPILEAEDFIVNQNGNEGNDVIHFQFTVPHAIQRDTLYVHAQVEVSLEELGRRRRILLNVNMKPSGATTNKIAHFGKNIGITNKKGNEPKQPQIPPQEPISPIEPIQQPPLTQPFTISLSSTWIIIIGALLSIILLCNIIYMCYMNCCKGNNGRGVTNLFNKNRRSGYRSVKNVDSEEFDISDANIINM